MVAACATSPARHPEPFGDVLTGGELARTHARSVYDAVRRLRPRFLRVRGPSSLLVPGSPGPAVWIDETYMGGVDQLRDVPTTDVVSVRYLSAWDAATRYGPGFPYGVLVITTRP